MKKPGEETVKDYKPAKQYMAGWNHMTGMLRRHLFNKGVEAAKTYADEVLNSVNPEQGLYQRGRCERAFEFLKVLTEESKETVEQVG